MYKISYTPQKRYKGTSVVTQVGGSVLSHFGHPVKIEKKNLFIVCVRKQNICSKFPALPQKR